MTDELITDLSRIPSIRVISRTSVMRFKGTKEALPAVAKALGVDLVVEGSVRRSGQQVRIAAKLVEAAAERNLWAESFDRDLKDVFALQSEVATAISREVGGRLSKAEEARLAPKRPGPARGVRGLPQGEVLPEQARARGPREGSGLFREGDRAGARLRSPVREACLVLQHDGGGGGGPAESRLPEGGSRRDEGAGARSGFPRGAPAPRRRLLPLLLELRSGESDGAKRCVEAGGAMARAMRRRLRDRDRRREAESREGPSRPRSPPEPGDAYAWARRYDEAIDGLSERHRAPAGLRAGARAARGCLRAQGEPPGGGRGAEKGPRAVALRRLGRRSWSAISLPRAGTKAKRNLDRKRLDEKTAVAKEGTYVSPLAIRRPPRRCSARKTRPSDGSRRPWKNARPASSR